MSGEACNITPSGVRRRATMGWVAAAAAIGAVLAFDGSFESRWWRLGPAAVLAFAFLCLAQARAKT